MVEIGRPVFFLRYRINRRVWRLSANKIRYQANCDSYRFGRPGFHRNHSCHRPACGYACIRKNAHVFAHAGHITKEEAKEISGLAERKFEKAYEKASTITENVMVAEGTKMDKLMEHIAKEFDDYFRKIGDKFFM